MISFKEFSFTELTSNSCGKTSGSIVCGILVCVTGCLIGLKGAFTMHNEAITGGLGFVFAGGTLLGIRRFTKDKDVKPEPDKP